MLNRLILSLLRQSQSVVALRTSRRPRLGVVATGLFLLAIHLPSSSGPATTTAAIPDDASANEAVTLNMRDADIRAVVHWLANLTGKKFTIDPRVKGNLSIYARDPLTADNAYAVVVEAMRVYGFATVESDGIVRIVPDIRAKTLPIELNQVLEASNDNQLVTHVLTLTNLPASELVMQLKPLVPPSGHLVAVSPQTLLMIDDKSNVKRLARLAGYIDQQGTLDFEVIALQYAAAESIKKTLLGLSPEPGNSHAIATDERSNSVLLSGNASRRRQWRQMIQSLDRPQSVNATTQVFYLHYLSASELLPVLRGLALGLKNSTDGNATSGEISIEALEAANAIVVNGPKAHLEEIASVIRQTDYRRAQVLVDAIIVEVSDDFARQIGVQWKTAFTADGAVAASNFGLAQLDQAGKSLLGQGLSLGFLKGGDLRILLQAVANDVDANILSRPSIVTLDNEPAEILVGQNIPLITGQSTGPASSTENPFTTVERKDIGITLKVTPQINEGSAITLDVLQEVENVVPSASTLAQDIVTNKRSVKTKVLVEDQEILVLGGLIDSADQESVRKVPLLGDIPLLGALFRTKKVERLRRNLMVFIRPSILEDAASGVEISRQRYQTIRGAQQSFNERPNTRLEPTLLPQYETIAPRPDIDQQLP